MPMAAVVFYRALIPGNSTAPVDALIEALAAEGIAALPIFVASLKDAESESFLDQAFTAHPAGHCPQCHRLRRLHHRQPPTLAPCSIVRAAGAAGGSSPEVPREDWQNSLRGLSPRDLTMNVVLPDVDGRVLTRAVSFKEPAGAATTYRQVPDRIAFCGQTGRRLGAASQRCPRPSGRSPSSSPTTPDRDGRIANGVGLDTPESTARLAAAMAARGYVLPGFPQSSAELMALLLSGPTNALPPPSHSLRSPHTLPSPQPLPSPNTVPSPQPLPFSSPWRKPGSTVRDGPPTKMDSGFRRNDEQREGEEWGNGGEEENNEGIPHLTLADYAAFFDALPEPNRLALTTRWGAPESDPSFIDGAFRIAAHRFGNIIVGIQPARGYAIDPKATYHDADLVPPHGYLAFYAWLRRVCRVGRGRASRQARQPRMASRQSPRPVGDLLAGNRAWADAADLSVHRQRSRRGQPGQAAELRRHRRSPDAADDPRRDPRPARRARDTDRRILRRNGRRQASGATTCSARSWRWRNGTDWTAISASHATTRTRYARSTRTSAS